MHIHNKYNYFSTQNNFCQKMLHLICSSVMACIFMCTWDIMAIFKQKQSGEFLYLKYKIQCETLIHPSMPSSSGPQEQNHCPSFQNKLAHSYTERTDQVYTYKTVLGRKEVCSMQAICPKSLVHTSKIEASQLEVNSTKWSLDFACSACYILRSR